MLIHVATGPNSFYTYESGKFKVKVGDVVKLPANEIFTEGSSGEVIEVNPKIDAGDYQGPYKSIVGIKTKQEIEQDRIDEENYKLSLKAASANRKVQKQLIKLKELVSENFDIKDQDVKKYLEVLGTLSWEHARLLNQKNFKPVS